MALSLSGGDPRGPRRVSRGPVQGPPGPLHNSSALRAAQPPGQLVVEVSLLPAPLLLSAQVLPLAAAALRRHLAVGGRVTTYVSADIHMNVLSNIYDRMYL
jgi:hypothetical protein